MEEDGRIGGDPVPAGGPQEGSLTPEEMAVLEEMGMNVGGYVPQQQPPQAVGNTAQQGMSNAYAEGGLEDGVDRANITTPAFTQQGLQDQFGLGYSLFGPDSSTADTSSNFTTAVLYSPDGMVRSLTLPTEQAEYDKLISEGWTTSQTGVTTETSVGKEEPEGRDGGPDDNDSTPTESVSISDMTNDQLSSNAKAIGVLGTLGKVALGPVASTALGTLTAARYNDILDEMTSRGLDTTGMGRKGSIFGGEESLLGGLNDTNNDGKVNFGDTFLGDLLGLDGKVGVQGTGLKDSWNGGRRGNTTSTTGVTAATVAADAAAQSGPRGGGNEGRGGGNEAAGVDGPAAGANTDGNAPGVAASASSNGVSAGAAGSSAAGSGHEGNADPDAGGSMLNKGGFVSRRPKKKKK